jgi:dTDP-4-dehydrorhamnose 3,5-epimerase
MKFNATPISGLIVIEPKVHHDGRGFFFESFKKDEFRKAVGEVDFVQENESLSKRGTLRGLHYQIGAFAQAKLVRVIVGEAYDVAVDMRPGSATFGRYFAQMLSAENKLQMFIPKGFAHGFLALSEDVIFSYKVDAPYSRAHERGVRFDDARLNIPWPLGAERPIVSERDEQWPGFEQAARAE